MIAMQDEMKSLYKNQTWSLVNKPKDKRIVGCKWLFKKKIEAAGKARIRFKARLVA